MKRLRTIFVGVVAGLISAVGAWAETGAAETLQALVQRQKELLAQAAQAEAQVEVEDLRAPLQRLVNDYETYLRDYPEVAAGYVSYALLLGNPLLDERKRAAALLLKANELDSDLPIVKNQLGNFLAEEGRPLEAINYYLAAVQLAPEEPLYHYQIGMLLSAARDDFLNSGEWTRTAIDEGMLKAFARAAELGPGEIQYAYRYAESFYDLEYPEWEEALEVWRALEQRVETPVERQTMRLHQANIRLKQERHEEARALLRTVTEPALQGQKQKLEEQLP